MIENTEECVSCGALDKEQLQTKVEALMMPKGSKGLGRSQREILGILTKHTEGLSKMAVCKEQMKLWFRNAPPDEFHWVTKQVSFNAYAVLKSLQRRGLVYQGESKKWYPVGSLPISVLNGEEL